MAALTSELAEQLRRVSIAPGRATTLRIDDTEYGALPVPLASDGDRQGGVVLLRSVTEALAPYRKLRITLLLLTIAGVAAFAGGSILTARRIADPIQSLSLSAGA